MRYLGLIILQVLFVSIFALDKNETSRILSDFDQWKSTRSQFVKLPREYPMGWAKFACQVPEVKIPPQNIHSLAPWDIKVVAALGDSLTAARAASAEDFPQILRDNREVSFATGDDGTLQNRTTLHHLFNKFNSNLAGRKGLFRPAEDFNLAVSGSFSFALPQQARNLVNRLKEAKDVDMVNDWKFINVFIGSNDLCKICINETTYGVNSYESNLREALAIIKENIPRAYVNVMPPFSIFILYETHEHPFCVDFHKISCPCLFEMNKTEYIQVKKEFDQRLETILSEEGLQTETFAAVMAPVISKVDTLPIIGSLTNLAFVALDCFHFSEMAHDMVAKLVWRGLFEPVNDRLKILSFDDFNPKHYECPPAECPYLQTSENVKNCSVSTKKYPSFSGISVKVAQPVLPSLAELEARAWAEENGYYLLIGFIGVILLLLAVVFLCFAYKRSRQRRAATEETPLLLTANLYDDVF